MRTAMVVAGCLLLTSACANYNPVPQSQAFDHEAARISDNLNKPVSQTSGLKEASPVGPGGATGGGSQPFIVGQANNEDLLRGLTSKPVGVDLRFEDAEITDVANTILGDVLKKPYTIDTTLRGKVSLRVDRKLSQRDLMDALRQAVEKVGGEIRRQGESYQIANGQPSRLDDQKIAQLRAANTSASIVPLRLARASTVNDLLRAIFPGAQINVDEPHNLLIIGGPAAQRQQIASTAELLDVGGVSDQTVEVYPLNQSSAKEVAEDLKRIYQSSRPRTGPVDFIPLPRNNAVLIIAQQRSALARVNQLIKGMDQSRSAGRRMYVVPLQHARAVVLANVLRESMGLPTTSTAAPTQQTNPVTGQPITMSVLPSASATPGPPPPGAPVQASAPTEGGPPSADGTPAPWDIENVPLRIVASADNNSLLIFATPAEFGLLREAIRRLDAPPLQVLIEATILDVALNDSLQFGVQAFLAQNTAAGSLIQTGITASSFGVMAPTTTGFQYIFNSGGQVQQVINALKSVTKVTVLSSPQVVTLDNQKANLEVGSQVPITTQQVTNTTVNNPAVVNSISYVQTGVILSVTPRVNTTGGVDLDIRQEVTDSPAANPINPNLTPTLTRRVIQTRVSVQSSQTVALGGLITENTSDGRNRVPLLGDIPVLGWLFGQTNVSRSKEELLVFLTPTVFSSPDEARSFSLDLRRRLDSLWEKKASNQRHP